MTFSRSDWVASKKSTALCLAQGKCGGSYAEGVIILSATISAMASEAWPGTNIDKKRFVEITKNYCDQKLSPTRISLPILIGYLRDNGKVSEAEILRKKFMNFQDTRVLIGNDVDKMDAEILSECPNLTYKDIRRFSYICLLYEDIRSSFMHEYRTGKRADIWAMSSCSDDQISYVNWMNDSDRHIHYPVQWMGMVAQSVAEAIDRNVSQFPLSQPVAWWLDG